MGWAEVDERGTFYFAHSYAAETPCATAWSEGIVAEARLGSFVGCQFHPEKSGAPGAQYLESVCLSLV
jgi:imidazoleglycerol phosphate synthase glutamine amidotransferase subunit HisH